MPYETRVLKTAQEWGCIAAEWERLRREQDRPHIEQHPDWLRLEVERGAAQSAQVIALYQAERLVGIAPFLLRRWSFRWRVGQRSPLRFPMRLADFCGEALIAPADPMAQAALVRGALEAFSDCAVVRFEYLPVGSPLWCVLKEEGMMGGRHWLYDAWGVTPRYMIHFPDTFDEYLAKFKASSRRNFRVELRGLENACEGNLRFQRVTERHQLPAFLRAVEQVSARSWQGTRLGKVVRASEAEIERWGAIADHGWLCCHLLCNGEEPLSFLLGRLADGVYYADNIGYDPAWAKHAPGKVILYLLLQDFYAMETPQWLDFRRGHRGQKVVFSNCSYEETSAYLIRKTAYTGLAVGGPTICRRAKSAARDVLMRLGVLQKMRRSRKA